MDINTSAKKHYEYTKTKGTREERMQLAKLSTSYRMIDPEAAGWLIIEQRARQTLLAEKAQPPKPSSQKKALTFEDELAKWDEEEKQLDIKPTHIPPIQELDDDNLPF
jgi:hypothetical protein